MKWGLQVQRVIMKKNKKTFPSPIKEYVHGSLSYTEEQRFLEFILRRPDWQIMVEDAEDEHDEYLTVALADSIDDEDKSISIWPRKARDFGFGFTGSLG